MRELIDNSISAIPTSGIATYSDLNIERSAVLEMQESKAVSGRAFEFLAEIGNIDGEDCDIQFEDEAKQVALNLLLSVSPQIPHPEIDADPRGMIGLQWLGPENQDVVVTIKNRENIHMFVNATTGPITKQILYSTPSILTMALERMFLHVQPLRLSD